MKTTRALWNAISKLATPISTVEFSNALAKIWSAPQRSDGAREATIGLAISGGVDSMALAALCSQLQNPPSPKTRNSIHGTISENASLPKLRFQAFVVDHDVRASSDLEAEAVSEILETRGIPTKILKIRWPRTSNPNEKQGFESLARKYRFRILGKACRDLGINSLLLAHHEDDQAETVLMRMISGHRLAGLAGIRERSEIPENYGLYGVHESGGDLSTPKSDLPICSSRVAKLDHHLLYEDGGIQLYRPMLGFDKARLIATCQADEMKWFEDHTNKDPSLTTRNAIRHMYANHKLPSALGKESLLNISTKMKTRLAVRKTIVDRWLSSDKIRAFETRSGTLTIRFPHIKRLKNSEKFSISEKTQIAAELLKRILMLVTPEEHIDVSSLHGATARLFPEIESKNYNGGLQPPTGFTVAGVQFQPEALEFTHNEQEMDAQKQRKPEWFLSRQPLRVESICQAPPKIDLDSSLNEQSELGTVADLEIQESQVSSNGKIVGYPISMQQRIIEDSSCSPLLSAESHYPSTKHSPLYTDPLDANGYDSNPSQLIISKYTTPRELLLPSSQLIKPLTQRTSLELQADLSQTPSKHPVNIHIPSSSSSPGHWSPWSLFDNRYWIRVQNPSSHPLHIKHFTRTHLSSLKHTLPAPYRRYVQDLLKRIAPGNVRWTLPVVVKKERAWGWDQGKWLERVVGLPTLEVRAVVEAEHGNERAGTQEDKWAGLEGVRWEARYKKLYLDGIPLAKDLKPCSVHASKVESIKHNTASRDTASSRSQCTACGAPGHVEQTCWKAHPELRPTPPPNSNIELSTGTNITSNEATPLSGSSTKKKIVKRVAWLKIIRKKKQQTQKDRAERRERIIAREKKDK